MKRLDVDLVIVNERSSSYIQDLQNEIETAVRSSQSRPHFGEELGRGSVYALRADLMSVDDRTLLQSVARIALIARRGPIADQLARLPRSPFRRSPVRLHMSATPQHGQPSRASEGLEFLNGLGGCG